MVRFREEAAFVLDRAGERAALVAEELRFEERLRQRAAVDRDELAVLADRRVMDGARDELLARPALARQEHGRGDSGDPLDRPEDLLHAGALPDDVRKRVLRGELLLQVDVFVAELLLPERTVDDQPELLDVERLRDVVHRSGLHRFDRIGCRRVRGDHDDRGLGRFRLDLLQEVEAITVGHLDVAENEIRR